MFINDHDVRNNRIDTVYPDDTKDTGKGHLEYVCSSVLKLTAGHFPQCLPLARCIISKQVILLTVLPKVKHSIKELNSNEIIGLLQSDGMKTCPQASESCSAHQAILPAHCYCSSTSETPGLSGILTFQMVSSWWHQQSEV